MRLRFHRRPSDPLSTAEHAIDDELAAHFQHSTDDLTRGGLSRADAEAIAARRFGDRTHYRAQLLAEATHREHHSTRRSTLQIFSMSLRAFRRALFRSPGFALGVVAIMTLGLGANAVTFALVDRLVLSGPAGLHDATSLRRVIGHRHDRAGNSVTVVGDFSYADYEQLRDSRALAGAAAESGSSMLFGSGETAVLIQGRLVTAGYFPLLGVAPAAGRFFTDEESRQGLRVAVLSHAFWSSQFNADPAIIGQTVDIGAGRYEVIGITPRGFTGTAVSRVDVFLPLEAASEEIVSGNWRTGYNIGWLEIVARLVPGVGAETAQPQITSAYVEARTQVRQDDPNASLTLHPLTSVGGEGGGPYSSVAVLLWSVALLVLLIASANVANLFLARAIRQADQFAMRLALGASRARVVVEQAIEGALLALVGAAVAVVVALVATPIVQRQLFPDVDWLETTVNLRALLVVAGFAVIGGAIAAAAPAWRAARGSLTGALRAGTRTSRSRTGAQAGMLVLQGALSVVLLVGAGLFVRSLERAQAVDLGVDTSRLLVLSATGPGALVSEEFRENWRARIDRIPGVAATTLASGTIPFVNSWGARLTIPGLAERPRLEDGGPYIAAVEPGYFDVVGTTVAEGRAFTEADREGAPRVAIVNRMMARLYWPGQNALGKCMQIASDVCSTVVGIVENTRRQAIVEGDSLLYYVPLDQAPDNLRRGPRLIVRAADATDATLARVGEQTRRHALEMAPGLRYVGARPLDTVIAPQLQAWRLGATLFGVFGALALIVAAIGFYSVVSFDVEGRRREMGVRSALGASSASLLRLVVADGMRLALFGIVAGAATAWLLAPLAEDLLYGVAPRNPGVMASAVCVLALAAVIASALPAFRASRIDPSLALRND